jgi:hypothetical protein
VQRLTNAMREFSRRSRSAAVFAVMTFGTRVKTLQSLTADRDKLERAYDRLAQEPNGMSTHAFDAIDDAVRMLARHAPLTREHRMVKRAVVVITDGFPVGDVVSPDTVIDRANAADTAFMSSRCHPIHNCSLSQCDAAADSSGCDRCG